VKSRTWIRLAAIGAVLALTAWTMSICCTPTAIDARQHGCCDKGRCASMSAAVPIVALIQAKHRLPMASLAARTCIVVVKGTVPSAIVGGADFGPRLFTIPILQLRI
jgi:hypothetical protein